MNYKNIFLTKKHIICLYKEKMLIWKNITLLLDLLDIPIIYPIRSNVLEIL